MNDHDDLDAEREGLTDYYAMSARPTGAVTWAELSTGRLVHQLRDLGESDSGTRAECAARLAGLGWTPADVLNGARA